MDISKSIRICLVKEDKTQRWLSQQLGCSDQMVSMICRRKKRVSLKKLEEIASVFGMKASEFIAVGEE